MDRFSVWAEQIDTKSRQVFVLADASFEQASQLIDSLGRLGHYAWKEQY